MYNDTVRRGSKGASIAFKTMAYTICILLTILSIIPFWVMFVNATRDNSQINANAFGLIPSVSFLENFQVLLKNDTFKPWNGFMNSFIVSASSTLCTVYFSTMTAYALVAYKWKGRDAFFTFIMCVLMVPAQLSAIGFFQFMNKIGLNDNLLALILPSVAAPGVVFFMRQFMVPTLPMEILQAARIDGAGEVRIFNTIVLPIMKPAIATQAIFAFVNSWNQLFMPSILLKEKNYTMPVMVSLLRGDIYKTNLGSLYLGLFLTVLPLFVIYFLLSRYIIAGVALGGVKG